MSARPICPLEFDIVVGILRKLVQSRGEAVTRDELAEHIGVHYQTLVRHCGAWKDLRAAAGLTRPGAPRPRDLPDTFLIDEYRRIAKHLGRPPRPFEFNQVSTVRYGTLISRFGSAEALRRRARICDDFEETFGPGPLFPRKPDVPWDEAWLRELWPRVRVGFALHSSDLRPQFSTSSSSPDPINPKSKIENPISPPDIIFCALHDWLTAPVPVLVASDVLGERARPPVLSQPMTNPHPAIGAASSYSADQAPSAPVLL